MARNFSAAVRVGFLLAVVLLPSNLWAAEEQLIGIRIGGSRRDLMTQFGAPGEFSSSKSGFLLPGAGGMTWQSRYRPTKTELASLGGAATVGEGLPWWALPVRVAALGPTQEEWIYRVDRHRVSAGFIINGSGDDAVITDIIAAGFSPTSYVSTSRGIHLGSNFSDVLKAYGWPPRMEVYLESGAGAAGAGVVARAAPAGAIAGVGGLRGMPGLPAAAMRAGVGMPPGMRASVGATAGISPQMLQAGRQMLAQGMSAQQVAQMASQQVGRSISAQEVLQALGGQAGVTLPSTTGPVSSGLAAGLLGGGPGATSVQVSVDRAPVTLSRHAILYYEGVAFTLHRMRVVRIHISE